VIVQSNALVAAGGVRPSSGAARFARWPRSGFTDSLRACRACCARDGRTPPFTERSLAQIPVSLTFCHRLRSVRFSIPPLFSRRPDLLILLILIVVVNLPLLNGGPWHRLMFQPQAVCNGEWWRLFTHPFVHVTWYHLLLDASAFLMLYQSLLEPAHHRRLIWVASAGVGSLVVTWLCASQSSLCGLSGIAHGLMAVSAVELVARYPAGSPERRIGLFSFTFVVAKAGFEAISGKMFFAFLDFGMLGDPIVVSHAGGIVGALILLVLIGPARDSRNAQQASCVTTATPAPALDTVLPKLGRLGS